MAEPAEAAENTEQEVQEEEQPQEQIETQEETHLVSLARKLGHKAKEEFDGPEEKWVTPDEFVAKRFEILSERYDRTSNKLKKVEQTLESVSSHISKVEKVAYERAVADLKQERRRAIEDGDANRVEEIDVEIEKVHEEIRAEVPKKADVTEPSEEIQKWVSENKWFGANKKMAAYASATFDEYREENPDSTDDEVLAHVDKEVRQRFPEKFENPKRKSPPPVEPGGSGGASRGKGYSRNDLNEEQRRVHDEFVKRGVMSSAEYIKQLVEIGELGGEK